MKKIVTIFMFIVLMLIEVIPVHAKELICEEEKVTSSNEKQRNSCSSSSIDDIDRLIEQRNQAYLMNDYDTVNEITSELYENGMSKISKKDLETLLGEESNALSRSGATFETVYSTYTTGGRTYKIMRVYATPTTNSNLYMTGVTAVKNSTSLSANAMNFINITAQASAGLASNTVSTVQTVYGAISSYVGTLSPTTTIKNISASYTWNIAETCAFVYVKSSSGMWVQGAQYGKVSSSVTAVIPTLTYGTNGVIASSITKNYNGSATPYNYNSTAKAIDGYLGSVYTSSKVSKVIIKGIEGKTVKSIKLLNPEIPAMID